MIVVGLVIGIPIGFVLGVTLNRRLVTNNVVSAYDTGYHDGKAGRGYRKVQ